MHDHGVSTLALSGIHLSIIQSNTTAYIVKAKFLCCKIWGIGIYFLVHNACVHVNRHMAKFDGHKFCGYSKTTIFLPYTILLLKSNCLKRKRYSYSVKDNMDTCTQ